MFIMTSWPTSPPTPDSYLQETPPAHMCLSSTGGPRLTSHWTDFPQCPARSRVKILWLLLTGRIWQEQNANICRLKGADKKYSAQGSCTLCVCVREAFNLAQQPHPPRHEMCLKALESINVNGPRVANLLVKLLFSVSRMNLQAQS